MKKLTLVPFAFMIMCFSTLVAADYATSATVTPTGLENQHLVNIKVEKVDEDSRELVMNSSFVCVEDETAEVFIGSDSEGELKEVSVKAFIPKDASKKAELEVTLKNDAEEVLTSTHQVEVKKLWEEDEQSS